MSASALATKAALPQEGCREHDEPILHVVVRLLWFFVCRVLLFRHRVDVLS